tara:strand:+ start:949 stop:1056 length:108 start_codon:yes stop_codon:yes gene_type:complete
MITLKAMPNKPTMMVIFLAKNITMKQHTKGGAQYK